MAGIPTVLYVREEHALTHLLVSRLPPDMLVANSEAHAHRLEAAGYSCRAIPSVIDRSAATVESTRRVVLMVNPIPEHHVELVLQVARARPHLPFVLQESWPLEDRWRMDLLSLLRDLPNVELRERVDSPAAVYRDARVLLVPYPTNRPRIVAEAQHNGIPVVAADQSALAEAVGPGGVVVSLAEPVDRWADALDRVWGPEYEALSSAARRHDGRAEADPESLAAVFEAALISMLNQ
jgi:glycosyltransferase involved in cell wall biosynthesis